MIRKGMSSSDSAGLGARSQKPVEERTGTGAACGEGRRTEDRVYSFTPDTSDSEAPDPSVRENFLVPRIRGLAFSSYPA
jgi:hypothetical protein